ncbi:MAG: hypothetical protein KDC38_14680, partial [Planctomycetes bacterium]|nr:hypothetical protein [Planctomycetota bacterium]
MRTTTRGAIIAVWVLGAALVAHGDIRFSFVLKDTPHATNPEWGASAPNTIFGYDTLLRVAVPVTDRLATALAALDPDARVDALSYGRDVGGRNDHSYFYFGISMTALGRANAVGKTPLDLEPRSECESDHYFVPDRVALVRAPGTHVKTIDENGTSPVGASPRRKDDPISLGLTGVYGWPTGSPPDVANVSGFDLETHDDNYTIYFSVDRPVGGFSPADILMLDVAGTIHLFRAAADLGLDASNDDIDGLALNLWGVGLPPGVRSLGWYSLTRASQSVALLGHAAGDLFEFEPAVSYGTPPIHMRSERLGLLSRFSLASSSPDIDADVDSISHIDPESHWSWGPPTGFPGDLVVTGGSPLDSSYTTSVDGRRWSWSESSIPSTALPPIDPGDFIIVEVEVDRGSHRASTSGVASIPGTLPAVQQVDSTAAGSVIEWVWTNPIVYGLIEVRLDGDATTILPGTAQSFTVMGLDPGVHTLRIIGSIGADVSDAVHHSALAPGDPALPPPWFVEAVDTASGVELTWVNPIGYDALEVELEGNTVASVGPVTAGQTTTVTFDAPEGRSTAFVRGFVGTAATPPSAAVVDVSPLRPGALIRSGSGVLPPVADLTHSRDGLIYVVDGTNDVRVFDPLDLDNAFASIPAPGIGTIQGLAASAVSLFWVIDSAFYETDFSGGSVVLLGSIAPPGGGPVASLGFDGDSLWAVDRDNGTVTRHSPTDGTYLGTQIVGPAVGPVAVSGRPFDTGFIDIAHEASGAGPTVSTFRVGGQGVLSLPTPLPPIAAIGTASAGTGP